MRARVHLPSPTEPWPTGLRFPAGSLCVLCAFALTSEPLRVGTLNIRAIREIRGGRSAVCLSAHSVPVSSGRNQPQPTESTMVTCGHPTPGWGWCGHRSDIIRPAGQDVQQRVAVLRKKVGTAGHGRLATKRHKRGPNSRPDGTTDSNAKLARQSVRRGAKCRQGRKGLGGGEHCGAFVAGRVHLLSLPKAGRDQWLRLQNAAVVEAVSPLRPAAFAGQARALLLLWGWDCRLCYRASACGRRDRG